MIPTSVACTSTAPVFGNFTFYLVPDAASLSWTECVLTSAVYKNG